MTQYFGDYLEDETVYIPFNTFDSNDPSASVTITNLVDADIKVHKDGSATQIVTDGATVAIDFDSITGNHLITIDTSVHADYATGSDYMVRIEGTTVDGATINAWVGSFSIENRTGAAALRPTTSGRTLDVTATGAAGIDWGNVENQSTVVDLSATDFQLVDTCTTNTDMRGTDSAALASNWTATRAGYVDNLNGHTAQTGDSFARIGANGNGLSAIPWNASWDTEVQSEVNDGLVALGLDHLFNVAIIGTDVTDNSFAAKLVSSSSTADYDDYDNTTDALPALSSSLGSIANVGSAVHKAASSYTLTTGTQSSGLYTDTEALDGVSHQHTDAAGALDLYYEATIGGGTPSSVQVTGYVTGANDSIDVYGYDWVSAGWKQIGSIQGSSSTSNQVNSFDLFVNMVGSGADEGKVRVRFYKASGLTSATLSIDQIFVAFSQGSEGYDNGAVWFNSNASNTNTVVGIDGTSRNPVSTSAALLTLLASTNLKKVEVIPGSTFTLGAAYEGYDINGNGAVLALNSQNIGGSIFSRFSSVTGIGTTSANRAFFEDCLFGATATIPPSVLQQCGFGGTLTVGSAGDLTVVDGYSTVAGSGSPTFTKTAGQAVTIEYRRWSGGIVQSGLQSGDTITIGGLDMGAITLNGADAAVELRGIAKALTNNLTGSPTVNNDLVFADDIASILTDTGTTLETHLTDIKGGTFSGATDSLEAIRDRGDAAWITGAGGTPPQLLQSTTIATLSTQTSFTLTAGSADDDAYNGHLAIITDQATSTQKAVGVISDYTGSTKTITLDADPGIFTMATTDIIDIVAVNPASSAPTAAAVADAVWDEALSGHNTGGTAGKYIRQLKEGVVSIESTVNDLSASTTVFITDLTEASDSHYSDLTLVFIDGNLLGQAKPILSYNGTTKTITLSEALSEAPADGDAFIILTTHIHPVSQIVDAVWDEATSGHSTAGTTGKALTDMLADTNELQGDWVNGGRLDLIIDAIKAVTDLLPDSGALTSLATAANLTTVDTVVDGIQTDLSNATDGLGALKTLIDNVQTKANAIEVDTQDLQTQIGTAGAGLTDLGGMSTTMKAQVNTEADTALTDYDPPTNAEMEARTPTAAQLAYITANAATALPVTFTTSGGSTTAAVLNQVDSASASATDDQYNGRLLVFIDGTLKGVVTDITDYVGSTTTATITAIPVAPTSSHNAILI